MFQLNFELESQDFNFSLRDTRPKVRFRLKTSNHIFSLVILVWEKVEILILNEFFLIFIYLYVVFVFLVFVTSCVKAIFKSSL